MFKIDQIKHLFDCCQCNLLLVDPVTLPCGYNVCERHIIYELLGNDNNKLKCQFCPRDHPIPEDGFIVNKQIQKALDIKLNTLKLNPVYDECKNMIMEAKENVTKIESLERNAESYIYEYFEDIKRKVDLRREDLKMKIDTCSDELIKSIESNQLNCIKLSKEVDRLTSDIEKFKQELNELVDRFDTFEINDAKFTDIKQSVTVLNDSFTKILEEYNDSLIGNKEYTFKFKDIEIEDIFGRLEVYGNVIKILFYFIF